MWTPIPIPHKLVGMSVHDLVRDLQMQGTALVRETMNALYLANRPQREVVEGQVNFEDLLNPTIGGLVRVKAPGMVREIATGGEGVIQQSLQMMEQLASIREQRTGSTRYNQGMDANSLNKTATGISMIQNASTQRAELIARQFAESGMKPMFNRMLSLVCRHMNKGEVIKLRGKWVPMNPAEWRDDYDLSVTVGLGTGNRDQQVSQMMQLIQLDSQIIQLQGGANGPLLTMPNVYEKLKTLVEAMGHKGVENFYTDPASEHDGGQPQQDPGADQKAQQDAAAQADAQKFQAQSQLEMQKAQLDADTKLEVARIGAEKDIIIAGMQVPPELSAVQGGEQPPQGPPQPQQAPDEPDMPQQAPVLSHGMPGDHYMPAPQGDEPDPNMPQAPIDPSMMS